MLQKNPCLWADKLKDKTIHEQGLVSVFQTLYDELDSERAREEAGGQILWLRSEDQNHVAATHPPRPFQLP